MKKIFVVLILGFMLSGCSTNWYIQKAKVKCPECFELDTTINQVVFTLDTIIKIDTNILVLLPRDTVRITKLIPKTSKTQYIKKKNGIITVEVFINKDKINIVSFLDSALWYKYQDEILIKDAIIHDLKTVTVKQNVIIKKQKKTLKDYLKWIKAGIIILIVLLLFGIGYKFYKWIKK